MATADGSEKIPQIQIIVDDSALDIKTYDWLPTFDTAFFAKFPLGDLLEVESPMTVEIDGLTRTTIGVGEDEWFERVYWLRPELER